MLVVFKPSNPSAHEPLTKKPKRSYDKFRIFQDFWATKFFRAKLVLGENSQISLMKCKICSVVEGNDVNLEVFQLKSLLHGEYVLVVMEILCSRDFELW
jgi:hypothetical protein